MKLFLFQNLLNLHYIMFLSLVELFEYQIDCIDNKLYRKLRLLMNIILKLIIVYIIHCIFLILFLLQIFVIYIKEIINFKIILVSNDKC